MGYRVSTILREFCLSINRFCERRSSEGRSDGSNFDVMGISTSGHRSLLCLAPRLPMRAHAVSRAGREGGSGEETARASD